VTRAFAKRSEALACSHVLVVSEWMRPAGRALVGMPAVQGVPLFADRPISRDCDVAEQASWMSLAIDLIWIYPTKKR
jgi:hypothetical protein